MKFSDNKTRTSLTTVYVRRTKKDMESRDEANSNLWELHKENAKKAKGLAAEHLYSTPARDVRIGESIYNSAGKEIAYRTS